MMTSAIGWVALLLVIGVILLFAGVWLYVVLISYDRVSRMPEWLARCPRPGEANRRQRELYRQYRANRLELERPRREFQREWIPVEVRGLAAYVRADYDEANAAFAELLGIAERFDLFNRARELGFDTTAFRMTPADSLRWWQRKLLVSGEHAWNKWRRKNPTMSIDLRQVELIGYVLKGVNLSGANLAGACLFDCILTHADLSYACLSNANLAGASMAGVVLRGTTMVGADLSNADLTGAIGLTDEQLASAIGDFVTQIPDGNTRPAHWNPGSDA